MIRILKCCGLRVGHDILEFPWLLKVNFHYVSLQFYSSSCYFNLGNELCLVRMALAKEFCLYLINEIRIRNS